MLNMRRPSDQAKLLFFALLRGTVSAMATESKAASGVANLSVRNNVATPLPSNIQLRLARRTDVPSIQRCNLAALPENYNSQFYSNHLRQWPDLCLVAEDIMARSEGMDSDGRLLGSSFPLAGNNRAESNVVAYVLGKVEQRPPSIPSGYYMEDHHDLTNQGLGRQEDQFIGHVTSLAVLQPYRRKGLANALMEQLHYHLEEVYGAGAVGLHVRKSNTAACRLYQQFGYKIDLTIPRYYQDGEDAYFMKKTLRQAETLKSDSTKFPFLARRPARPWEAGPMHLRLPRDLKEPDVQHSEMRMDQPTDPAPSSSRDSQQHGGLFTGIM